MGKVIDATYLFVANRKPEVLGLDCDPLPAYGTKFPAEAKARDNVRRLPKGRPAPVGLSIRR
jgi:hypothetical protein